MQTQPCSCKAFRSCDAGISIKGNKLELAVWSEFFHRLFSSGFKDSAVATVNIEDADPAILDALIRALYEKEVGPGSFVFLHLLLPLKTVKTC